MSASGKVTLRQTEPSDLDAFYRHQLDPDAIRVAAFLGRIRSERAVFDAHWANILKSGNFLRTVVVAGQVAGYVALYPDEGRLEVTYWIGKEFWGRGVATDALAQALRLVTTRPLSARAAADNVGSLKVLQKCGFKIVGHGRGFALGRGEDTDECILRLDPAETGENPA